MPSPRSLPPVLGALAGTGLVAGLGLASYAAWEARQYTLRRVTVPVLPSGAGPLTVLHVSDIHLAPDQRAKMAWLRELAALEPDLVINTGDNIAHRGAVEPLLSSFGPLLERPGVYVLGSNDYFAPGFRNPFGYLLPDSGKRHVHTPQLPWRSMKSAFSAAGWVDLTNRRDSLSVGGLALALAGVDDPHLGYDDLDAVAGPADPSADLRLAVTHAPYLRVLDAFAHDGYDAIIAGHTHGGQVCLPGGRALTTNCDLEPGRAHGLSRHPAAQPSASSRS